MDRLVRETSPARGAVFNLARVSSPLLLPRFNIITVAGNPFAVKCYMKTVVKQTLLETRVDPARRVEISSISSCELWR